VLLFVILVIPNPIDDDIELALNGWHRSSRVDVGKMR
jgi:hypothetical protein